METCGTSCPRFLSFVPYCFWLFMIYLAVLSTNSGNLLCTRLCDGLSGRGLSLGTVDLWVGSFSVGGAVLCTVGCLPASLSSPHLMPNVLGVRDGQNHPQVRTTILGI